MADAGEAAEARKPRLSDAFDQVGGRLCSNRTVALSRVWIILQALTLCIVIAGVMVAVNGGGPGYSFLGVYVAVLSLMVGVVGTLILRKYRTPARHGLLLGLTFMMGQLMLFNAVLVGTRRSDPTTNAAEKALGALSVFQFGLYMVFTLLLYVWRDLIIVVQPESRLELGLAESLTARGNSEGDNDGAHSGDLTMV